MTNSSVRKKIFLPAENSVADPGGAPSARPPRDQNFFNSMQFFGKSGKCVCWRPLLEGWRPLLREILDAPLQLSLTISNYL